MFYGLEKYYPEIKVYVKYILSRNILREFKKFKEVNSVQYKKYTYM